MSVYSDRVIRLQRILREEGLVGAVFAPTDQMRYLAGWAEPGHERLIALFVPADGEPVLVAPAINAEQARRNPAGITDVRGWDDSTGWHAVVADVFAAWGVAGRGLVIDDELLSVHLLAMQELAPRARCVAAGALMARLREIKSEDELELMSRSGAVTDAVYGEAVGALREGMTELDLEEVIRQAYRKRGTNPAFAIVCFGANSALPHHHNGDSRLCQGDVVVIDIGCALEGYASDITRTVAFGEASADARRVYDVVLMAHRAALDATRPGVSCESVDTAARRVIGDAGFGEYFIHRTGHGIGLSGHEPPYIVQGNKQLLQAGMCFSDEPGIYLPGRFGVRIENILTVTWSGARYLNADPPAALPVIPVGN